jgi:hypothetical protein
MACEQHVETREKIIEIDASTKSAHHRIDDHKRRLDMHDEQIGILGKTDERQAVQIDNVCKQMGGLTKAIWFFASCVFGTLVSFFVWYVQSIGK